MIVCAYYYDIVYGTYAIVCSIVYMFNIFSIFINYLYTYYLCYYYYNNYASLIYIYVFLLANAIIPYICISILLYLAMLSMTS